MYGQWTIVHKDMIWVDQINPLPSKHLVSFLAADGPVQLENKTSNSIVISKFVSWICTHAAQHFNI